MRSPNAQLSSQAPSFLLIPHFLTSLFIPMLQMLVIPSAQVSGSWLRWAWTHQRQIRLSPERIGVSPRSPQAEGRIAQWLLVFLEITEERRSDLPYPRLRWLRPCQWELPHSQKVNHGVGITRRVTTLPWTVPPGGRCCLSIAQLFTKAQCLVLLVLASVRLLQGWSFLNGRKRVIVLILQW